LPVTYSVDERGVGWIVFDTPGSAVNLFDPPTRAALACAIAILSSLRPKALVLASTKEGMFVAGADLQGLSALADAKSAEDFSRAGQRLFQAVADFPAPVVAAINGACAGGGYELALACDWRIASEDPSTRIGLPEVGLGTLPGWGGSVRLPRLIGAARALDHILEAKLERPALARTSGLVDELVPSADLKSRAGAAALEFAENGKPKRPAVAVPAAAYFSNLLRGEGDSAQPSARSTVIDVIRRGIGLPFDEALGIEAHGFGLVTPTENCRSRVRDFFASRSARRGT
jgi:3-hydroxyacyl-CoA dehydrogenase/enoyl-CoA hydratase/3-hydroxybutyryl-CoA epimerase